MATKNYMINDKWLDLDKQNIVELQSVDGEIDSLKVNGSEIETPSGKITITENGTDIDVAQYALADVNVEGGGGDLNNPIQLELEDNGYDQLVTVLSAGEIYALCQTGTPYFTVTAEQNETYQSTYKPDTKYFINEYFYDDSDEVALVGFSFVMLGIADTSNETVRTTYDILDAPVETSYHLIIAGGA